MKNVIVIIIFFIYNFSFAQDTIVLKTGINIQAKVIEIGLKEIKYKKSNNLQGPNYIIKKNKVEIINHKNGMQSIIFKNLTHREAKALYKQKISTYKITTGVGLTSGIGGLLYLVALTTNNIKTDSYNYLNPAIRGSVFTITGTIVFITSMRKLNNYSKRLKNLSISTNLSQKEKGISLMYRF